MSLPIQYHDSSEYFLDVLNFLQKYSWVYKISNTSFIKENILLHFPDEWTDYFLSISINNLNLFPENLNKDIPPKSIKNFQEKLQSLKPNFKTNLKKSLNLNDGTNLRKVNAKKVHEISILANYILDLCKTDIDIYIDFGCGLGYLIEYLHKLNNNIKIIGLESVSERVSTANKRMIEYFPTAKENIYFLEHFIQESSNSFILENVQKLFPFVKNPKIAIIGLHSCADLTNISMEIFLKTIEIKKLIVMPCCYHKLEVIEKSDKKDNTNTTIYFKNFPLSNNLKILTINFNYGEILNRPFLRLACQQTVSRWREMNEIGHIIHGQEMFVRALIETVKNENEIIFKNKQKSNFDLDLTFEKIKLVYEIRKKEDNLILPWTNIKENKIKTFLSQYPNGWKLAEALTCLQTSIQELCENLVLYDRICYLNEQSQFYNLSVKSKFEKILDDKISPRCFVLISEK